ncbi:MAG: monovalent cation/H+ antiporter subunit D family protein, partial [Candidatus Binatia bacterium]
MTGDSILVAIALFTPLVGAGLIAFLGRWPNLREAVSLLTAVFLAGVVFNIFPHAISGDSPTFSLFEVLPGLQLTLSVEPLGLLYASVASGLWILTSIYSIGYMRA